MPYTAFEDAISSTSPFIWILLASGVVLLAAGAIAFLMARVFVAKAARAEATVVVTEEELKAPDGTPSGQKAKFWVAEFQDRKGLRQRLRLGESMDFKMGPLQMGNPGEEKSLPSAGSRISVLFDPDNPIRVRRDSFGELWRLPVALLAAGTLVLAVLALLWTL